MSMQHSKICCCDVKSIEKSVPICFMTIQTLFGAFSLLKQPFKAFSSIYKTIEQLNEFEVGLIEPSSVLLTPEKGKD